jgi:hypothetical protein
MEAATFNVSPDLVGEEPSPLLDQVWMLHGHIHHRIIGESNLGSTKCGII